ncbi:ABC transporter ATP-binding protein [Priestia koreensis]|uniref:ABC transporter ATP-binding protein n=1 Tax=Priestia koreensis TaxID=284581 RepID=UPI001F5AFD5B|nr:ABC transporter ATP-binding protein [Priestia koreensis]UNL85515.1 ABC transporter ATP-binding protein [Priestia koreensis]
MGEHLLEIKNLSTSFKIKDKYYAAVDDVSITVNSNEIVAIVGESGCGKSALALSINRLHNSERTKMDGKILYKGKDVLSLSNAQMNKYRGKEISMIFQEPLTALNPLMTIGKQIEESLSYHTDLSKNQRKDRACELLDQVGIPKPELTYKQFPHELSGGMRQRAMIAIAIACNPSLIIADEPTTALDVTIQAQILDLLKSIQEANGMGVVLITHDLSVVAEVADRVVVMYAGQVIETGTVDEIFNRPQHPYTRSLLNSVPTTTSVQNRLHVIEGVVPSLVNLPRKGCRFKGRIPWIEDALHEETPELHEVFPGHHVRCTCYKHFYFKNAEGEEISHDIAQSK